MMLFGILFQEYHTRITDLNHIEVLKHLRFLWVMASFFLIIAYSSNLKVRM